MRRAAAGAPGPQGRVREDAQAGTAGAGAGVPSPPVESALTCDPWTFPTPSSLSLRTCHCPQGVASGGCSLDKDQSLPFPVWTGWHTPDPVSITRVPVPRTKGKPWVLPGKRGELERALGPGG